MISLKDYKLAISNATKLFLIKDFSGWVSNYYVDCPNQFNGEINAFITGGEYSYDANTFNDDANDGKS
jgi:hypothetical protein